MVFLPTMTMQLLKSAPFRAMVSHATAPKGSRLLFYPFAQKEGGSIRCRHSLSKNWLNAAFSRLPWRPCAYGAGREPCRETLATQGFLRICRTPPGGLLLSLRDNSPCAAKADESLRGAKPSAASGGRSEAEAQ